MPKKIHAQQMHVAIMAAQAFGSDVGSDALNELLLRARVAKAAWKKQGPNRHYHDFDETRAILRMAYFARELYVAERYGRVTAERPFILAQLRAGRKGGRKARGFYDKFAIGLLLWAHDLS